MQTQLNSLTHSLGAFGRRCLAVAGARDARASVKRALLAAAVLGLWLALVIFTATRHEFWRDEVRALSLARAAASPVDLYGLTQYEGHPVLWFLLLYIGKSVADIPLVLPVISIAAAFAAVAIFMYESPYPFWLKCLFVFGGLPLYEYAVMARNYGISMLLLFTAAVAYRARDRHGWLLAAVLALLANTNAHSAILACLIAGLWAWDLARRHRAAAGGARRLRRYLPLVVVLAGVALCATWALPRENTILTSVGQGVSPAKLAGALFYAVLRPDITFARLLPAWLPFWVAAPIFFLAVAGLAARPDLFLAAFTAQVAFGVFFRVAQRGVLRHQGLYLMFLVFLYWLLIEFFGEAALRREKPGDVRSGIEASAGLLGSPARQAEAAAPLRRAWARIGPPLFRAGLYGALAILFLGGLVEAKSLLQEDLTQARSSSRAFGAFLDASSAYHNAIIVPEPDYLLESLPYYARNRLYFPRERRFGTTTTWTTAASTRLSLGELLAAARAVRAETGQPVLVVIGHRDFDQAPAGERKFSYGKVFTWDAAQLADLNASAALVADFESATTDENYRVYALLR